ncbi:unnamed protein product, partial [Brenthis ino]
MTKKLSAKRKVDKCRDMHPRARRGGGEGAGTNGAACSGSRRAYWPSWGCSPAPSSRLALIELGLSFDFKWGKRAVLRASKLSLRSDIICNRHNSIYSRLIQLCGCEHSRPLTR